MTATARWREMSTCDARIEPSHDLLIRTISEIETPAKVLVDHLYFESADVLRCYEGRFRFTFSDHDPIELAPGEVLFTFPRRYVTIEALGKKNRLVYGIIGGNDVETYFESLGIYDCLKGVSEAHYESIMELGRQLAHPSSSSEQGRKKCLAFLTDILRTQIMELSATANGLVLTAVREINGSVRNGIVRLNAICANLGVSRSYLHRAFASAGIGKPSDYIRKVQLRFALSLIRGTRLTVAEIALRAGFHSPAPFVCFIKDMTGYTPAKLRQMPVLSTIPKLG